MERRKVHSISKRIKREMGQFFKGDPCKRLGVYPLRRFGALPAVVAHSGARACRRPQWPMLAMVASLLCFAESRAQTQPSSQLGSRPGVIAPDNPAVSNPSPPLTLDEVQTQDPEEEVAIQRLAAKVRFYQDRLSAFADDDDLVESVYYPLFDRPYRRATVAILLKMIRLLEAEVQSQRAGEPVLTEASLGSMTAWCDGALKRLGRVHALESPVRSKAIRRSTLNVKGRHLLLDGKPVILTGWIDRSRTREESPIGDLVLMACLGANLYGQGGDSANSLLTRVAVEKKCEQLGIGYVNLSWPAGSGAPNSVLGTSTIATSMVLQDKADSNDLNTLASKSAGLPVDLMTFFPPSLTDLLTLEDAQTQVLIRAASWAGFKDRIVDSDLTASLLTRQTISSSMPRPLMGLEWRITSASGQVIPTPREWRAAMWSQLFSGQRGGLFEGWREPKRSDWLPNESIFLHPALLETQAHAGLDARRVAHLLASFPEEAEVAILVGRGGVTPELSAWSKELTHLHSVLRDRQIAVDVCPISMLRNRYPLRRYKEIILFQVDRLEKKYFNRLASFSREGVDIIAFGDALREDDALQPAPSFRFALWTGVDEPTEIADYITRMRDDGRIGTDRIRVEGPSAEPIPGVRSWVGRLDNGQPCVGLIHLGSKPIRVVLKVPPSIRVDIWRDALTGQTYAAKGHVFPLDPTDVWILEGVQRNGGAELADGSSEDE